MPVHARAGSPQPSRAQGAGDPEAPAAAGLRPGDHAVPALLHARQQLQVTGRSISRTPTGSRAIRRSSTLGDAFRGGDLLRWLGNSALFTVASVAISTVVAALAAYPISLMRWRPGRVAHRVLIALMVVPADRPGHPALQDDGRPRAAEQLPQRDHRLHGHPAAVLDLPARQLLPHDASRPAGGRAARRRRPPAHLVVGRLAARRSRARHRRDRAGALGLERGADRRRLPAERGAADAHGRDHPLSERATTRTSRS